MRMRLAVGPVLFLSISFLLLFVLLEIGRWQSVVERESEEGADERIRGADMDIIHWQSVVERESDEGADERIQGGDMGIIRGNHTSSNEISQGNHTSSNTSSGTGKNMPAWLSEKSLAFWFGADVKSEASYSDAAEETPGLIDPKDSGAQQPLSVLLVLTDQWRAGAFSFSQPNERSGVERRDLTYPSTPHLDAFARDSIVCTRAFAANPVCTPSRATILTGRWPHE